MAATFESFSIREYVLKKRSVDLGLCWPFGEETLRKGGKECLDSLPPISCRKFRWWSFENSNIKLPVSGDVDGKSNNDEPENPIFPPKDLETQKTIGQNTVVLGKASGFDGGDLKAVLVYEAVLDGENGFEKICPVCKTFSSTTINAVNAHIDNCLEKGEKKQGKNKSRVPKKRSIVEIFAAAPHVETVEDDDEEDDEEEDESNQEDEEDDMEDRFGIYGCFGNGEKQQQQQREEAKSEKGKIFKARRKCKTKDEETLHKKRKEKLHKPKLSSPADFSSLPQAKLQKKKLRKLITGSGGIQAKKPSYAKKLTKQKQLKIMRTSKLGSKHPQGDPPVFPIHSILKNQTGYLQGDGLLRHIPHAKPPGRHVRFSGKDDVLGSTKKFFSPTGLSQTETLRKVISDAMADLSVADRPYSAKANDPLRTIRAIDEAQESIESDDRVYGNKGEILTENPLPSVLNSNNRSCHEIEKAAHCEPMDLNQALQQFDNLHLLNPVSSIPAHNLSCLLNSFSKEGISSDTSTQAEGIVLKIPSTSKRFPVSPENPIARFPNAGPLPNLSRSSTMNHPITCIGTNIESNAGPPYRIEPNRKSSISCFLQYPLCPLPQKDPTATVQASLPEPKKQSTRKNGQFGESNINSSGIASTCTKLSNREKYIDEDFLGLPLNLSGKLRSNPQSIYPGYNLAGHKLNPGHFNMQEKAYIAKRPPNHNLKLFSDQNYPKKCQISRPVQSRLGLTKLANVGRTDELDHEYMREKRQQQVSYSDSELSSIINVFGPGSQDYNQSQHIRGKEKTREEGILDFGHQHTTQPTVRLMGKNVMVGRSNNESQGFEETRIWKDKEIIIENRPTKNQCFRQERIVHPVSQASKDNGNILVERFQNSNLPKILQFTSSEPGFAPSFLNSNTHLMRTNDLSLTHGRYGVSFSNLVYPLPSQTLPNNQKSKPTRSFISETESGQINLQNPIAACNPLGACLQHDQNFAYRGKSAFQFPFSSHDCGEYIQSSWPKSPPSSLPQWLLTATQQNETPQSSQHSQACSDPIVRTNPFTICGTNLLPSPPPYLTPALTFSAHKPNTSHPCLQNSSSVASLINPLLIPAFPGFRPSSTFNTSSRNRNKPQEKRNSKFTQDHVKKAKKRPATKAEDASKAFKRMRVDMHEKSSMARTGSKKRDQLYGYTQYNAGASDIDKTVDACFSPIDIDKNGSKAGGGVNCLKQDGFGRSGPIKLSAGARHILKPSHNAHQDNSRPIHSTIPFVVAAPSVKEPDLQKKTAKIYRF